MFVILRFLNYLRRFIRGGARCRRPMFRIVDIEQIAQFIFFNKKRNEVYRFAPVFKKKLIIVSQI